MDKSIVLLRIGERYVPIVEAAVKYVDDEEEKDKGEEEEEEEDASLASTAGVAEASVASEVAQGSPEAPSNV